MSHQSHSSAVLYARQIIQDARSKQIEDQKAGAAYRQQQALVAARQTAWIEAEAIPMPSIAVNSLSPLEYAEKLIEAWLKIGPAFDAAGLVSQLEDAPGDPDWLIISKSFARSAVAGDKQEMTSILQALGDYGPEQSQTWNQVRHWLRTGNALITKLPDHAPHDDIQERIVASPPAVESPDVQVVATEQQARRMAPNGFMILSDIANTYRRNLKTLRNKATPEWRKQHPFDCFEDEKAPCREERHYYRPSALIPDIEKLTPGN